MWSTSSAGRRNPTLHRMEADGLLESRPAVVSGRWRRIYVSTEKGRELLASARRLVRGLAAELIGEDRL